VPRYYITIGPQSRTDNAFAPAPTWVVDAADEEAARNQTETLYRLSNPEVDQIRIRVTRASALDR
jgi:hypothetical protein